MRERLDVTILETFACIQSEKYLHTTKYNHFDIMRTGEIQLGQLGIIASETSNYFFGHHLR